MADEFRGLTLRLGADARPLKSAISSIQRSAGQAQKQLNAMNKALKFDGNNITAVTHGLDLANDKARLAARAAGNIETAMMQASDEAKKLAGKTTNIYSETQKVNTAYNDVDRQLQHIYDAAKKVYAQQHGLKMDSEQVVNHFAAMKRNMSGTGQAAVKAKAEMRGLIAMATLDKGTGLAKLFNVDASEPGVRKMLELHKRLVASQKDLNAQLDKMHEAEGYRAMQTQLVAWETELRKAAAEATDFRVQMARLGDDGDLPRMYQRLKRIDSGIESASNSAREMTSVFSAMPKSMEAARAKVRAMNSHIESLKDKEKQLLQVQQKIANTPGFDKMAAKVGNVHAAFAKAKSNADDMRVALEKANAKLEELEEEGRKLKSQNVFGEYDDDVRKLDKQIEAAVKDVQRFTEEVRKADATLDRAAMAKEWRETDEEILKCRADVRRYDDALNGVSAKKELFGSIRTAGYGLMTTLTPAITMAGRYSIQAAEDIDSAYRDMRKTVNGTEEDFEHLKQAAIDFSLTHVTSAQQILEIEAIGGQLGVQVENLEGFARTVSNLDIATNMDTEQIAENLGQLAYIMDDMDQSQESLDSFADALVRLGNNSATQEDKIMNVMMRIASMGTILNMSTHDLLALSTAVAASGQGAEAAGTAISKTFSNIESAVSGPESAMKRYGAALAEGGEDLDDLMEELEESSGDLEAFAKIAGMSADEFAAKWHGSSDEVMDAFQAFVSGLHSLKVDETGSIDTALEELGIRGVRQKQTLMNLSQTVGELENFREMSRNAWNGIADEWGQGSDAMVEAEKKSEGFSGSMEKMRNAAKALGEAAAEGATPFVKALTELFTGLAEAVNAMPQEAKTAIVAIAGVLAAAGPAMVAVGTIGSFLTALPEMATKMKSIKLFKNAIKEGKAFAVTLGGVTTEVKGTEEVASKLAGTMGTFGKLSRAVGVGAFAVGFTMLAAGIGEAIGKAQTLQKATDGLESSVKRLSTSFDANASFSVTLSADAIANMQAELADKINQTMSDVTGKTGLAQHYADEIKKIREQWTGSEADYIKLKSAVDGYNEATGSAIEITDREAGTLSISTAELDKNTAAFIANARVKALQELYEEAVKNMVQIEGPLERAQKVFDDAKKAWELDDSDANWTAYKLAEKELNDLTAEHYSASRSVKDLEDMLFDESRALELTKQSTEDFRAALSDVERDASEFDDMASQLGLDPDDFAAKLSVGRVGVTTFAKVSREEFEQMCREENGNLDAVIARLADLDRAEAHPLVSIADDASSRIRAILEGLSEVDRARATAVVRVVTKTFGAKDPLNATGGLSPRIIRAIPRNAAGGINGIVTRPMLTNVGWVGEAGDEALLHMKNAGGAIIPLSNRQHVRPFAQAVAYEMGSFQQYDGSAVVRELQLIRGSLSSGQVNINVTVNGAGDDYGEIGRRVGREAAYELRMQGVCA